MGGKVDCVVGWASLGYMRTLSEKKKKNLDDNNIDLSFTGHLLYSGHYMHCFIVQHYDMDPVLSYR